MAPKYTESDLLKSDQDNGYYSLNGYSTSGGGYHAMLDEKKTVLQILFGKVVSGTFSIESEQEENEDGWSEMRRKKRPFWWRALRKPIQQLLFQQRRSKQLHKPGTLILVRHGESLWNANKTFTGWADPI